MDPAEFDEINNLLKEMDNDLNQSIPVAASAAPDFQTPEIRTMSNGGNSSKNDVSLSPVFSNLQFIDVYSVSCSGPK